MTRSAAILCALIALLGSAIIAATWYNLHVYLKSDAAVVEARDQMTLFRDTVARTLRAQVHERDYLLTRQNSDKDTAAADIAAAHVQADRFAAFSFPPPLDAVAANVNRQLPHHLDLMDDALKQAQGGSFEAAERLVMSADAAATEAALRADGETLKAMLDEELRSRIATCHAAMIQMTQWVLVGLAALAIAVVALIWSLRHHYIEAHTLNMALSAARDRAIQANRDKDEFLGVLSHELRTPLTPALLTTEMLERQTGVGSDMHQDLALVREQLQIEIRLIDDLLDVSRVLQGHIPLERASVQLNDLVKGAAQQHCDNIAGRKQTLEVNVAANSDRMMGDSVKLRKVFWHLIGNASKFTPDGGKITVATANLDGRFIAQISDTGIGFTEAQRTAMFEPFKQVDGSLKRRYGGLGVGLALAKPIVELHGGTLTAQSRGLEQGATFTIELPVMPAGSGSIASRPTESMNL